MTTKTYVSAEDAHPEPFLDRIYALLETLNQDDRYQFAQQDQSANEFAAIVRIASTTAPEHELELHVDFDYGTVCIIHSCEDPSALDTLEETLRAGLDLERPEHLLDVLERDLTPRNLLRFGQGYEKPLSSRAAAVLNQGLKDPSAKVREFTAYALLGRGYRDLLDPLEDAMATENDARVREAFGMARASLEDE